MTREQAEEMILDPQGPPPPGSADRAELERRLAANPDLRALYEQQQEVFAALDAWEAPSPSPGFDAAVRRRLQKRSRATPKWWAAAAAAAACLLLVVSYGDERPGTSATPGNEALAGEVDQALEDLEMLVEFEALLVEGRPVAGRS